MNNSNAVFWLKLSFMVGAVTDALALLPMIFPFAAKLFWGFNGFTGMYWYAMGMGASLMLAWTILLLWAYRKPLERRYIALFTVIVIAGFVATEIVSVCLEYIQLGKIAVSFVLQAILMVLFSYSFVISDK